MAIEDTRSIGKEDIKQFWDKTLAVLAAEEIHAKVEPAPEQSGREYDAYSVAMCSFEGRRIRAWYCIPKGFHPGQKLPSIMSLPGYGGNSPIPTHLAAMGYAVLSLYPRGQGESAKEWELEHNTKLTYNLHDPEQFYYRGAYMDCIRGIDFLCTREEIDPNRIGVWGRSQGGGLTLATVALDQRAKTAVAEEPFLSNYPISVNIATSPYSELRDYLIKHPDQRERVLSTLAYFDPLSLAENISCPILLNIGMKDDVCPYHTIMPIFESIKSTKAIFVYPELAHEPCGDFNVHAVNWFARYLV